MILNEKPTRPDPTITTNTINSNGKHDVWVAVNKDTVFLYSGNLLQREKEGEHSFLMKNVDLGEVFLPCKLAEKAPFINKMNVWSSSWQRWDNVPSELFQNVINEIVNRGADASEEKAGISR